LGVTRDQNQQKREKKIVRIGNEYFFPLGGKTSQKKGGKKRKIHTHGLLRRELRKPIKGKGKNGGKTENSPIGRHY